MIDEDRQSAILNRPKAELHTHIEGAAPPAFIQGLAKEKNIDISRIFREDGSYDYRDFVHFLSVYEAATSVLTGPAEFARLTTAILTEAAENGVVYMETFISPDFCGGSDVAAWKEYLHAIQDAADAAQRDMGITLCGIATPIRHFGPDKAKLAARCAAETAGEFIVGLGMGGDENQGRQGDFAYSFDMAREAGLHLTTHAGEWRGPQEVRDAVEDLGVTRIGHGVRVIEDLAVVDMLIEREITLEICPGSNVFLGVYDKLEQHPIEKLRERGVKVTVSTDDPPFFRTTMRKEYADLMRVFDWDAEIFDQIDRNTMDAAFCGADTKARIRKLLEAS
ncbi:adenosine deaminase [Pelagimonas varians]|uniref:Aminodeoxyfutalosine deaminase n=1 Tax=Pelagimonas varians TaxID=696760 RepID=A0A238K0Y1_9RHOB|nr:adenosine deaminase [Pelagimonas varians]PYG33386.1 adenosine deaminase [Pelagimonas varians]SMX36550.1 Aminodeoxyfutalosine deaminase [Pelagimonas varians]